MTHTFLAGDIERLLTSQGGGLACASSASTPQQSSDFCPRLFFDSLRTARLGRMLLTSRRTSSTQSVLQDTLRGVPDGLVFVADRQISGKGKFPPGGGGGGGVFLAAGPKSPCRAGPAVAVRFAGAALPRVCMRGGEGG